MSDDTPWIPSAVQELMDYLEENSGVPAVLDARPGRWQVTHSNDRIRLVCLYSRSSTSARRLTVQSYLSKDGQRSDKPHQIDAYIRLFNDPDIAHPNRTPGKELTTVFPLAEEEAPPVVINFAEEARKTPNLKEVQVGHAVLTHQQRHNTGTQRVPVGENPEDWTADPHRYALRMTMTNDDQVQVVFGPSGRGGTYAMEAISAVDASGADMLSGAPTIDATALLESILGFRIPGPSTNPAQHNARTKRTDGAVSNSVTVRNASVFRI